MNEPYVTYCIYCGQPVYLNAAINYAEHEVTYYCSCGQSFVVALEGDNEGLL